MGNQTTYTNRAGSVRTATFDTLNRETGTSWNDGVTPATTRTYDSAGRLATLTNSVSQLTYTYDNANQLLSEVQNLSTISARTNTYAYDSDGRRLKHTYPAGNIVTNTFTARGQISAIYADGTPALATFIYDANGNRTGKTLENSATNSYTYDNASRMTSLTHKTNGTAFASFDYGYNTVGSRTNRTESSACFQPATDTYSYDATDQIASVNYNTGARTVSYQWDAVGNRTTVTDNGVGTNYTANSLNQYTAIGGGSPTYDTKGNFITQNGWTYTFDAQNRLLTATNNTITSSFSYDSLNRCVSRTLNGTTTLLIYDRWNLIEEWTTGGVQLAHYVHGPRMDEILMRVSTTNAVYYHHDALGNTTHLTGTNGAVVERYTYDIFGAVTIKDGSGNAIGATAYANRFLFTGREWLADISLYDYRNRVYSPELGRFLQTDPIRFEAGDMNIYRYCGNNSVGLTDPLGLWSTWAHNYIFVNWNTNFMNNLTANQVAIMQQASAQADAWRFQATGYSFMHSMAAPGQTNATQMSQAWIQSMITAGQNAAQAGNTTGALVYLGFAMHTIQDAHSPLHTTNGNPNTWNLWGFWPHVFQGEGQDVLNRYRRDQQQNYNDMLQQMQDAYNQVFNGSSD